MKIDLKPYIPKSMRIIANYFLNRSTNPHNLRSILFPPTCISDYFIWSPMFESIEFIANNNIALITGKQEKVEHVFKFYSPSGNLISEYNYLTKDFITKIKLAPKIDNDSYKYLSFTHFSFYDNTLQKSLRINGLNHLRISNQSRGYTIYTPKGSNVGSTVHGNLGGITSDNSNTAKTRNHFIYTPIYNFSRDSTYDLVINNPTSSSVKIKASTLNNKLIKTIEILPMGTDFITLKRFRGGISFESKLPICRPLVFKDPPPDCRGFDVFHS